MVPAPFPVSRQLCLKACLSPCVQIKFQGLVVRLDDSELVIPFSQKGSITVICLRLHLEGKSQGLTRNIQRWIPGHFKPVIIATQIECLSRLP